MIPQRRVCVEAVTFLVLTDDCYLSANYLSDSF